MLPKVTSGHRLYKNVTAHLLRGLFVFSDQYSHDICKYSNVLIEPFDKQSSNNIHDDRLNLLDCPFNVDSHAEHSAVLSENF